MDARVTSRRALYRRFVQPAEDFIIQIFEVSVRIDEWLSVLINFRVTKTSAGWTTYCTLSEETICSCSTGFFSLRYLSLHSISSRWQTADIPLRTDCARPRLVTRFVRNSIRYRKSEKTARAL